MRKVEGNPPERKIGDKLTCEHCGKVFIYTRKMNRYRKHCDRKCYIEAYRANLDKQPYPRIWYNGRKEYLHRVIFMQAHPEIELTPEDIIHHIDENPYNRDPSNLQLIRADDENARHKHLREHNFFRGRRKAKAVASSDDPDLQDCPF